MLDVDEELKRKVCFSVTFLLNLTDFEMRILSGKGDNWNRRGTTDVSEVAWNVTVFRRGRQRFWSSPIHVGRT